MPLRWGRYRLRSRAAAAAAAARRLATDAVCGESGTPLVPVRCFPLPALLASGAAGVSGATLAEEPPPVASSSSSSPMFVAG